MNWKIIFQLSLLGLIMAFATVSLIPQKIEPAFWLPIFVFSAYVIAKRCTGSYFLNGFMLSIVNCVWIVTVHVIFSKTYMMNHPDMTAFSSKLPGEIAVHPRWGMVFMGPVFGIAFGILLGFFAFIAAKIMKK